MTSQLYYTQIAASKVDTHRAIKDRKVDKLIETDYHKKIVDITFSPEVFGDPAGDSIYQKVAKTI